MARAGGFVQQSRSEAPGALAHLLIVFSFNVNTGAGFHWLNTLVAKCGKEFNIKLVHDCSLQRRL